MYQLARSVVKPFVYMWVKGKPAPYTGKWHCSLQGKRGSCDGVLFYFTTNVLAKDGYRGYAMVPARSIELLPIFKNDPPEMTVKDLENYIPSELNHET